MTSRSAKPLADPKRELRDEHASRFLSLGLRGPAKMSRRPVDELIRWLGTEGGRAAWSGIEAAFPTPAGTLARALVEGRASLPELLDLKDRGKRAFQSSRRAERRHLGTAVYFLALAAALVHHQELVSSLSRAEVEPIWRRLGELVPPPWSELLERAAGETDWNSK